MRDSVIPGLRPIRDALKLTQVQVGEAIGVSGETICNIESGARGAKIAHLHKLSHALGCKPEDLLAEPSPERIERIVQDREVLHAQEVLARQAKRRELEQLEAGEQKGVA